MPQKSSTRDKILKVRLTSEEFGDFAAEADRGGVAMSTLARALCLKLPLQFERRPRGIYHPVDPALLRSLSGIGNLLNQLAGWANTRPDKVSAAAVLVQLVAVERALSDLEETQREIAAAHRVKKTEADDDGDFDAR